MQVWSRNVSSGAISTTYNYNVCTYTLNDSLEKHGIFFNIKPYEMMGDFKLNTKHRKILISGRKQIYHKN